jgi:hypothetical protein
MRKAIFCCLFLLFYSIFTQAQTLSKAAMYADFDSLVATIKRISPHIPLKKDLWQYDALAQMTRLRIVIDTLKIDLTYFLLLEKTLNLAQDMHTSSMRQHSGWAATQD